jgi:hypothetical protein
LGKRKHDKFKRINHGALPPESGNLNRPQNLLCTIVIPWSGNDLAFIDFPLTVGLVTQFQQTVFGIVTFSASGTDQVAAPTCAAPVVVRRHGKTQPATARHQEHFQRLGPLDLRSGTILFYAQA